MQEAFAALLPLGLNTEISQRSILKAHLEKKKEENMCFLDLPIEMLKCN